MPLLVLAVLPLYRKYLRDEQPRSAGSFDWLGGVLLAAAIALLLMSVSKGLWLALGALLALALFLVRINKAEEPFIAPKLFRNAKYTLGLTISFLVNGTCCSLYVLSPLLLANVHKLPSVWIGFMMIPAAAAAAIFGRKGGKLADSKGNSFVAYLAAALLVSCFLLLSTFTGGSPLLIAGFLILGNVGQSFLVIAVSNSVSRTLQAEQVGVGMGMLAMVNFIAQGIAIGVYSKAVDLGSLMGWNPLYRYSSGFVFSNISFVLAGLSFVIWVVFYFVFGRVRGVDKAIHASTAQGPSSSVSTG